MRQSGKIAASLIVFGLGYAWMATPSYAAESLEGIVATVNGEAILRSDYEKRTKSAIEQVQRLMPGIEQNAERMRDLRKRVLDDYINDLLLKQETKKKNIRVSQLEIDKGVKTVRERFQSEKEFTDELAKEGLTFDTFKKKIQDELAATKLLEQEVRAKITPPSDSDVQQLYDLLMAIINDKPLPTGLTSSDLEDKKRLARAMNSQLGENVHARHILIRVDANASEKDRQAAMEKIKDIQKQLKKGADFGELAKKYSQDPGSKDKGGDLGRFGRGDMVPTFDKVAFSLPVGEISDIVTTDFGYHIIKVEEKKAATKPTLDLVKDDLKSYLYQQQTAKRFEDYLKDLRSKAAVKVK